MTAVSAIILGLLFGFQRPNRHLLPPVCCLRVRIRRCGFLRGGRSFYFNPPPSVKLPIRRCVPDCSTTPTTCSAQRCVPFEPLLSAGARLLHSAAHPCQPLSRTPAAGSGPLAAAAWLTLFRVRRSFEGVRLLQLAAPICQPPNCEADFLRPSNFSSEGRGFYISAASFVNRDSDPDISPVISAPAPHRNGGRTAHRPPARPGLFNCGESLADPLIRSPLEQHPPCTCPPVRDRCERGGEYPPNLHLSTI